MAAISLLQPWRLGLIGWRGAGCPGYPPGIGRL